MSALLQVHPDISDNIIRAFIVFCSVKVLILSSRVSRFEKHNNPRVLVFLLRNLFL